MYLNSINISWNALSLPIDQVLNIVYTVIINSDASNYLSNTSRTYIVFNASTMAPKCEAYNFSVTAFYDTVGTTYNSDSCSVPSHLLNQMIPSEPDIKTLESSLEYELTKEVDGGISFAVNFKVN